MKHRLKNQESFSKGFKGGVIAEKASQMARLFCCALLREGYGDGTLGDDFPSLISHLSLAIRTARRSALSRNPTIS